MKYLLLALAGVIVISFLHVDPTKKPPMSVSTPIREVKAQKVDKVPPPPKRVLTQHETWLQQAGIPESDWAVAEILVMRESSWNPTAVNPKSAACGLAQALPCSKVPGDWSDPVNSLRWMHQYILERPQYGTWQKALNWHDIYNWY